MADYDPSKGPLGWAQLSGYPWMMWRRPTDMTPHFAAASMYYRTPLVLREGKSWSPEQELPVEERRIIMPHEFRSSPGAERRKERTA